MSDDIQRDLGRVEGKLDTVIASLTRIEGKFDGDVKTLDTRVRKVENRQYWFAGGAGVIAWLASKIDIFTIFRP